ncbi:MAG: sulfurtransferase TusA family protein [Thermoplasmata archaeon]
MLNEKDLASVKSAKLVDARGTACPGPLLAAKKAMSEVPPGGILEVWSSDPGTNRDLPFWAKKMGHEYLGTITEAGYWKIFVKKGK